MDNQKFKVETPGGETWEWEIHAEDKEEENKEPIEWNKVAIGGLAIGALLCIVGLLTLSISVAVLFTDRSAVPGMIAGSVMIVLGFLLTTPSAILLVRDIPQSENDKKNQNVAVVLPLPKFTKMITSEPQIPRHEDKRYLLAAERLAAVIEEPEVSPKSVSSVEWKPTPSPRTSPTMQRRVAKPIPSPRTSPTQQRRSYASFESTSLSVPSMDDVPCMLRNDLQSLDPPSLDLTTPSSPFKVISSRTEPDEVFECIEPVSVTSVNAAPPILVEAKYGEDMMLMKDLPTNNDNSSNNSTYSMTTSLSITTTSRARMGSDAMQMKVVAPRTTPPVKASEGNEEFLKEFLSSQAQ